MRREQRIHRIEELSSSLFDRSLSDEEQVELNDLLRGDPEACELYLAMVEAHAALLHDHIADDLMLPESVSSEPVAQFQSTRPKRKTWPSLAAAAVIFVFLNLGIVLALRSQSEEEPTLDGEWIAVLSRTVDAEWVKGKEHNEGDGLPRGEFRLQSGLAHIEFFSGASVIVEGPAHLTLSSAWNMACHEGKLRTFVPEPAQGFTIETPEYDAVDLGTEFALRVDDSGRSELLVVDGEVRIDDKSGTPLDHVHSGEGILSEAGNRRSLEGDGSDYIGREILMGIALADSETRYRSWQTMKNRLELDPEALVLFDFENQRDWDRQLENRVPGGPDGAIIGAAWGDGRWERKRALEFKRITDRIRLRIPGEFTALSFCTWVRVDGRDRWLSSLMLTDGFEPGEVHWQLSDKGELILGVSSPRKSPNSTSEPVIGPKDLGRWIHLAVTVDQQSGEVIHYLDGRSVAKDIRDDLPLLRLGDAEIGNWNSQGKQQPIRSLNGTIDEFVILKRVLSSSEIQKIYEAGRRG